MLVLLPTEACLAPKWLWKTGWTTTRRRRGHAEDDDAEDDDGEDEYGNEWR